MDSGGAIYDLRREYRWCRSCDGWHRVTATECPETGEDISMSTLGDPTTEEGG